MKSLALTRPQPIRLVALATLAVIIAWAAATADLSDFGVLAYPAIIALQTTREWSWRLDVTAKGLHERPGIGPARDVPWKSVESLLMPDSKWWRINPVIKLDGGPNIQMTASEGFDQVVALARRRNKPIVGTVESVTLIRSLAPWVVVLGFAILLLGFQLSGVGTGAQV